MDSQIVAGYCIWDDLMNALCHYEAPLFQMNNAEVITAGIITMLADISNKNIPEPLDPNLSLCENLFC